MSLFGKRKPAPESSGHALDDATLAQIVQHGGDPTQPRDWTHYLYFVDEATARAAADRVSAHDWRLKSVDQAAVGDGSWIVVAEQRDVIVNAETVRAARVFFESIPGADYDGWEASV